MLSQLQTKLYSIDTAIRHLLAPAWHNRDFGLLLTAKQVDAVAQGREAVRFRLLPLLRANLHRIAALSISLPESVAADVYSALDVPAPLLEKFELNMPTGWTGQLDTRLFASVVAAALKEVHVTNVAFPEGRIYAFANARFLSFTFEGTFSNADRLFPNFPSLQELQIDVLDIQTDCLTFSLPMVPGVPNKSTLLEVQARMPAGCLFFSYFPHMVAMNIPDMQWDIDDKWSGIVPEDLSMEIFCCICPRSYICLQGTRILLRAQGTNCTRRVDILSNELLSPALLHPQPGFGLLGLPTDILGVSTAQLMDLSVQRLNLRYVEVLAIRCDEAGHAAKEGPLFPLQVPRPPLQCSAIRMLVLEDELETGRVHASAVADFIDKGLDRDDTAGTPLDLMLKGVAIGGDLGILGRRIQRIFICGSDDTSGWLRGLVEADGSRCKISDYGRRDAGEEARDVTLVAQLCMDGVLRAAGNGWASLN